MGKNTTEELDLRILEALGIYGPRNFATVARKMRVNADWLRKRMRKHLLPQIFLNINIYHTNLGLRKCVVFADAFKGKEEFLYEALKTHDFWLYDSRCYGAFEGCLAIYCIPFGGEKHFEAFLTELERRNIASKTKLLWSTCFHTVNPTHNWFDAESKKWVFKWGEWIEEIPAEKIDLPLSLIDPKEYPQKADYVDVFILKELEVDATRSLTEIAKKLGMTKQAVKYHFEKHILKNVLMESFQVISFPFDKAISDFSFFTLWFPTEENMAKFAMSLLDKPFVRSMGKVFGQNGLLVQLYLPRLEFREFVDSLSELCRRGFLKDYSYVLQDWRKIKRDAIPFQLFSKRKWLYDQDKFLAKLDALEKTTSPQLRN